MDYGFTAFIEQEFDEIAKGEVQIVIGTQLVAKGHNFPFMTLVGVIDADVGLASGDPRAAERTFQMLQQVTGRAGRGAASGRTRCDSRSHDARAWPPFGRCAQWPLATDATGASGG